MSGGGRPPTRCRYHRGGVAFTNAIAQTKVDVLLYCTIAQSKVNFLLYCLEAISHGEDSIVDNLLLWLWFGFQF